ncbi:MAG: hypothetical protein GX022_00615 [Clostridiaceae bacterium]|nr:hypothetical protein [Clostridiaceae bacterium]
MNIEKHDKTVNILTFRPLAKFKSKNTQIFFQEKRDPVTGERLGIKEPVTLFIDNAGDFFEYPLECIQCVVVRTDEPQWSYICDDKIKISVGFKVILVVKFSGSNTYEIITLPDDIGVKCTTLYDLSVVQVSRSIYQTMQRVGDRFIYTMIIPFSEFEGILPQDNNFTVIAAFRNMTWNAEIGETDFHGTGSPPVLSTRVDLSIFYDIFVRIVVEEEMTVSGIVE